MKDFNRADPGRAEVATGMSQEAQATAVRTLSAALNGRTKTWPPEDVGLKTIEDIRGTGVVKTT